MVDLRSSNKHLIVGLVFLFLGLVLLLDQIGILNANRIFMFWPLALIFFGYYRFTHTSTISGRFWGGFCLLLGISLQAEEFGYGHVRFDTIWPVLLICAGILLILKRYEARNYDESLPPQNEPPRGPTIDVPPPGAVGSAVGSAVRSAVDSAVRSAVDSAMGVPPAPPAPPQPGPPAGAWPYSAPCPPAGPPADATSGTTATPPPNPSSASGSSFRAGGPPHTHSSFAEAGGARWSSHDRRWSEFEENMRDFGKKMDEFGERVHRQWGNPPRNYSESAAPRLSEVNIFWGGKRRVISKRFSGGDIVAIFGGFDIDLTESEIEGNRATIEVVAIFGGGELRVPPGWEVVMDAVGIFGGCSDRTRHPEQPSPGATNPDGSPVAPPKKLFVKGVSIFGGFGVKN